MTSNLTIYKASAGSGKTYTITREYLKLLLSVSGNYGRYANILAVTFTNKATQEMKSRIIKSLKQLSEGGNDVLAGDLATDIGVDIFEIRQRAELCLKKLLHDYSRFEISTIDSFFQKIIRAFAKELGLFSGYNIELEDNTIIQHAVDYVMNKAETDLILRKWIVDIIFSKIDEGKSWKIDKELMGFGKILFSETWHLIQSGSLDKVLNDRRLIINYVDGLKTYKRDFESRMKSWADKIIEIAGSHGLTIDDFKYKRSGVMGYIHKVSKGKDDYDPTKRSLECAQNPRSWMDKSKYNPTLIENHLNPLLIQIINLYNSERSTYHTVNLILDQIYYLGISVDLMKGIKEYVHNQNSFVLSDSSIFLKKIIDGSDAPFIYEKIGGIFRFYMIDEFQDTSSVQWDDFKPLISESLSRNNPNWVVGDVKQAIYRWRNTNWEILNSQVEKDFQDRAHITTLNHNWRSEKDIIDFNNEFFAQAITNLKNNYSQREGITSQMVQKANNLIDSAYEDCLQHTPPTKTYLGGYVRVGLAVGKNKSWKDAILEDMVLKIESLQDKGYPLKSIAILVKKKADAIIIADHLQTKQKSNSKYRYDIISSESLLLKNSIAVQFVMSAMEWICQREDVILEYFLNTTYRDYLDPIIGSPTKDDFCKELADEEYVWKRRPVYEFISQLIQLYQLDQLEGQKAYLQSLSDLALEFTKKSSSDILSFVHYWNENRSNLTIQMSDDTNAITLMTIHKSKGMEFDYVFIPFCDWELFNTKSNNSYNKSSVEKTSLLWCETQGKGKLFEDLPIIPLKIEKTFSKTIFAQEYYHEMLLSYVDSLNLLYVAFTRPISGLYVWIPDATATNNISKIVYDSLVKSQPDIQDESIYELYVNGNIPERKSNTPICKEAVFTISKNIPHKVRPVFLPSSRYYSNSHNKHINEGELLHDLFSQIKTQKDVTPILEQWIINGVLSSNDKAKIAELVSAIFDNPTVKYWFSDKWVVRNEISILTPNSGTKRPDRVISDGNETIVIDFKFGEIEQTSYIKQVQYYMDLLQKMGQENVSGYLWYVTLNKIVQC